jgi:tRNA (cmo5U34)-methyltransferase
MSGRDTLFQTPQPHLVDFTFDETVARVFPDMIRRSVPGYDTVIAMTGVFARHFVRDGSAVHDLGCSLGASTLSMLQCHQASAVRFHAVDNAPAMLEKCQAILDAAHPGHGVQFQCADVRDVTIDGASLVVMNFTLMFVPLSDRLALLSRICRGLSPGSALVLSEKIQLQDPQSQWLLTDLHHDFKRSNGYSDMEISGKRQSIENVLIPETPEVHESRLREAGFSQVHRWFQCFNFASWVAVR